MADREALIEAFTVYDHTIIHWTKLSDAFGAEAAETKAALELISEAREALIRAIMKLVESEL